MLKSFCFNCNLYSVNTSNTKNNFYFPNFLFNFLPSKLLQTWSHAAFQIFLFSELLFTSFANFSPLQKTCDPLLGDYTRSYSEYKLCKSFLPEQRKKGKSMGKSVLTLFMTKERKKLRVDQKLMLVRAEKVEKISKTFGKRFLRFIFQLGLIGMVPISVSRIFFDGFSFFIIASSMNGFYCFVAFSRSFLHSFRRQSFFMHKSEREFIIVASLLRSSMIYREKSRMTE